MTCQVCGKPLSGKDSWRKVGPVCRKHRAEALQLHLPTVNALSITAEDLETMEPHKAEPVQETGKPESADAHGEVIDWDQLRKPHED